VPEGLVVGGGGDSRHRCCLGVEVGVEHDESREEGGDA